MRDDGTTGRTAAERLAALGERYFTVQHTADPMNATLLGLTEFDGLVGDPSTAASAATAEAFAEIEREVGTVPVEALDAAGRTDHGVLTSLVHAARLDAEHALWAADASAKGYVSRQALILQAVPAMTASAPEAAERYLTRLRGLAPLLAGLGERYVEEARRGRIPTRIGVASSIAQLQGSLGAGLDADQLLRPARRADPAVASTAASIVRDEVRPAMSALAERLRTELAPIARDDEHVGIGRIPGGEAGYLAAVARHTTTDLTPAEIHGIGLAELELLEAEWAEVGGRGLGLTRLPGIAERMRTDPALRFETREQIVAVAQGALDRAEAARAGVFPDYDIPDCVIEEIDPLEAEHAALAYYRPPAVDGSRPGAHCLLSTDPPSRFRYEYEALAFHESVPGHHLQLATAQTLDIPRYRRSLDVEACSFNEGWGLYAEQLADELGLYSDDVARIGMLSFRALRACRLVIDTGVHAFGWSRRRGIDFMLANTATTVANAVSEVDRYIAWPGQALAYMIGRREILRLRDGARRALGDRFSLRDFHRTVLGSGAVPLSVLADAVADWQRTAGRDEGAHAWT